MNSRMDNSAEITKVNETPAETGASGSDVNLATLRCPNCGKGPFIVDEDSGELVCSNCGYILKEKMEEVGPEWRSFSKEEEEQSAKTGPPTKLSIPDMGLSTVIGSENRDASGRSFGSSMKTTLERLRTWDRRSRVHTPADRNLREAFSELDWLAEKLNVGDAVVEKAAYIYRKALERKLIRGRSISGMTAASLYAAVRDTETPRTLEDFAAVSNVKKADLARDYRLILKELDLRMPVVDPLRSISRIANRAGLSERTERKASEILKQAEETGIAAGMDPMGLAASALYIASVMEKEKKAEKDIAEAAGVTEVTIRKRYKGLKDALNIEMPVFDR
jgi:transcription initiation factor TFIIB